MTARDRDGPLSSDPGDVRDADELTGERNAGGSATTDIRVPLDATTMRPRTRVGVQNVA